MQRDPFQTFLIVFLVMMAGGFVVAFLRKGKAASAQLGSRRLDLHTPADPDTVFQRISQLRGKFSADDADPARKIVVLASSLSIASWGFLYPVFIHAEGSGSRIEVGCHSKVFQLGPVVTKWHRECASAIEQALA